MLMVTHDIEEAILVGQRILLMGGTPANIVESIDTGDEALKNRYSQRFFELQSKLEARIEEEGDLRPMVQPGRPTAPALQAVSEAPGAPSATEA
jgi:ABC-type proline/glycine betaine transport system ATPase subunit